MMIVGLVWITALVLFVAFGLTPPPEPDWDETPQSIKGNFSPLRPSARPLGRPRPTDTSHQDFNEGGIGAVRMIVAVIVIAAVITLACLLLSN